MADQQKTRFAAIPGFDAGMRHLASVPKEVVDKKMAAEKQAKAKAKKAGNRKRWACFSPACRWT